MLARPDLPPCPDWRRCGRKRPRVRRHPEVRALRASKDGPRAPSVILRGSPKGLAPQDDGPAIDACRQRCKFPIQFSNSQSNFRYESAIPRRDAPEVLHENCPSRKRGRREHRVHAAPAVSCAKMHKTNAHEHTGSAEAIRHSLRNGFTAYIALSPVNRAFLPPSPAPLSANLTPASGRQDHTTLPSASSAFVKGAIRVHRIPPRVRDDREPPL
jgi:hypothetical protein